MALGLALIAFLVLSIIGREQPQPEATAPTSNVIDAPVIPLPEGDIGGVSQETPP